MSAKDSRSSINSRVYRCSSPAFCAQTYRDGAYSQAGLIRDSSGNLYDTARGGSGGNACIYGCGTIFKLAPGGTESVLVCGPPFQV